ncbi:MAG TPA: lipoyl domain-containing protein [Candidatus Eremiobacteraceae bacterium]|nr:lipoyl domain-containing protein [Candidatus Eremiobacteraceae bacterium]
MPAPELEEETGRVLRWLKAPGDRVANGNPIVETETDKVTLAPRHEAYLPPDAGPTVIATWKMVQKIPTRFGGLATAIGAARFLDQRDRSRSRDL